MSGKRGDQYRNAAAQDALTMLASTQGYIAAQSGNARSSCPYTDDPLRVVWMQGYDAGIHAMTEWGHTSTECP